MSAEADIS